MNALILFSHGSVLCGAGQALEAHAEALRQRGMYTAVEVGYLNYSRPRFAEAVARCAAAGAGRIIVVPYFLVPGKFVLVDLARQVDDAREAHAGLTLALAPPIGFDARLADALLDLATRARPHACWREELRRAAASCESDPRCPLFETPACPRGKTMRRGGRETRRQGDGEEAPSTLNAQHSTLNTALLVLVHGSPKVEANAPMFRVVEEVRQRDVYPIVAAGFMECNEPDIPAAIASCVAQGARRVVAVPYFLHTGKHVGGDLPTALEAAQASYPHVEFLLSDFLGRAPQLAAILADRAKQAQ